MTPEACMKPADEIGAAGVLQTIHGRKQIRIPIRNDFFARSIDDLSLSVRSRNALMRAGLDTVGRLVAYINENDSMSSIRNLGRKSIHEVKLVLTEAAYEYLTDNEKLAFWGSAVPTP